LIDLDHPMPIDLEAGAHKVDLGVEEEGGMMDGEIEGGVMKMEIVEEEVEEAKITRGE
jgi:methenyltetrahydromethanopterin cyclohydrolase